MESAKTPTNKSPDLERRQYIGFVMKKHNVNMRGVRTIGLSASQQKNSTSQAQRTRGNSHFFTTKISSSLMYSKENRKPRFSAASDKSTATLQSWESKGGVKSSGGVGA